MEASVSFRPTKNDVKKRQKQILHVKLQKKLSARWGGRARAQPDPLHLDATEVGHYEVMKCSNRYGHAKDLPIVH